MQMNTNVLTDNSLILLTRLSILNCLTLKSMEGHHKVYLGTSTSDGSHGMNCNFWKMMTRADCDLAWTKKSVGNIIFPDTCITCRVSQSQAVKEKLIIY